MTSEPPTIAHLQRRAALLRPLLTEMLRVVATGKRSDRARLALGDAKKLF
jgi:hypothetical protein